MARDENPFETSRTAVDVRSIGDSQIESEIFKFLSDRDANSSVCPSEIARALLPSEAAPWRALMERIRRVLKKLSRQDRVTVTRGSAALSPNDFEGGPIRIRRGKLFDKGALQGRVAVRCSAGEILCSEAS